MHEGSAEGALLGRAAAGLSRFAVPQRLATLTLARVQIYLFHPMAVWAGMQTYEVPFPSLWKQIIPQVILFFFMEDTWQYVSLVLLPFPLPPR